MPRNATSFRSFHVSHLESIPSAMADQPRSKIIKDNPIGKGPDAFRILFNSIREGRSIPCLPDVLKQLGQEGKKTQYGFVPVYFSDRRADP